MSNNSAYEAHEYLFCPSENCINIPEISYSYNPLKHNIKYKCNCQVNEQNINIQEFLEKSNIICHYCKEIIKEENYFVCSDCHNIFDNNCKKDHNQNDNHSNFSEKKIKNHTSLCNEHNFPIKCYCEDCNKLICPQCYDFHDDKGHSILQISKNVSKFFINQNEFDKINSTFNKQKNILEEIKKINNDLISSLENDLKIKQKIIDNYNVNKTNIISNINIKNLYLMNEENYESLFQKILSKKENIQNQEKDIDTFLDEILIIFYYSLMILKDKSLANGLINSMEIKITNLNKAHNNIKDNKNINFENNINSSNILINSNNHNISNKINPEKEIKDLDNINPSSINIEVLNISKEPNFEYKDINNKNENNLINKENLFNSNINIVNNEYKKIENNEVINDNRPKKSLSLHKIKKNKSSKKKKINSDEESFEIYEEKGKKKEKKKQKHKNKAEKDKNFISSMVSLMSGNFAISNNRKVEIYDFRKLDFSKKRKTFNKKSINESNCLLQRIYFTNDYKGKYISYIHQFSDETLLCSVYSQIIRIKLINNDKGHIIIGFIKLEDLELPRKIISLGDSLLAVLSEKKKNCFIKIYEKNDNYQINFNNNNQINFQVENINQKNEINKLFPVNINNENKVQDDENEQDITNIKEDHSFKMIEDNFKNKDKLFVSIFEIKKDLKEKIEGNNDKDFNKYEYEFVATSNADLSFGKDEIIIYGIIKDNKDKYQVCTINKIANLSCSKEPNSICQISNKYLCIGLKDYGRSNQKNGFALINIFTRKFYVIIKDEQINCLFCDKENSLLMASMEVINEKYKYYNSKIYKIIVTKENEENDKIEFNEIYNYKNKKSELIISIQKIPNEKLIFITSSQYADLEIVKADI